MLVQLEAPVQPEASIEPEVPVEPDTLVQEAEEVAAKSINSSKIESDRGEGMVTRSTMTVNCFVPGAQPAAQQQPP